MMRKETAMGVPVVVETDESRLRDPAWLLSEAPAVLRAPGPSGVEANLENTLRFAVKMVVPDIFTLEQLPQERKTIDYAEVLGGPPADKQAAVIFLARYFLRYTATYSETTPDLTEVRNALTVAMQILYHTWAVEGLQVLYDYTYSQSDGPNAEFWDGVSLHLLYMMALLADARPQTLAFLQSRPHARRGVERIMRLPDTNRAQVARALGEDYLRARQAGTPLDTPPAPAFLAVLSSYGRELPDDDGAEYVAIRMALERTRPALNGPDLPVLAQWVAEGSLKTAQVLLYRARGGLTTKNYVDLMRAVLQHAPPSPVRAAAAILELGKLNRAAGIAGGDPNIMPLFREAAMTNVPELSGAARLAVRELAAMDAFNDALSLLEHAPMLEVAAEAMIHLRDTRRLALTERVVLARPILQPLYDAAFAHVQKAKNLMEAVWAATTDDLALVYLQRLKEMHAVPELQMLVQKRTRVSDLAHKTLAEVKLAMSAYAEGEE
jgi:hypothetical protein